jgi:bla regulator protein BlaR1
MRFLSVAILLIRAGLTMTAQSQESFEVASLKQSASGSAFRSSLDGAQFIATRHTLMMLIISSYPDLPAWRVSGGPSWIKTDYWDLIAKLPPNMPTSEQPLYRRTEQMLRAFLAEDFKLKTRWIKKQQPVYNLVVSKGGAKLKPSESGQYSIRYLKTGAEIHHGSMAGLAELLYSAVSLGRMAADRPVIDQTGLTGFYDFTLEWTPDTAQPEATASGPSIFTALEEQLGLKLQPEKAPLDILVIDHAERPLLDQ